MVSFYREANMCISTQPSPKPDRVIDRSYIGFSRFLLKLTVRRSLGKGKRHYHFMGVCSMDRAVRLASWQSSRQASPWFPGYGNNGNAIPFRRNSAVNWPELVTSIIKWWRAEDELTCGYPRSKNWRAPMESESTNCWPRKRPIHECHGSFPQNAREGHRRRANENSLSVGSVSG
jgi:hypothetical protein